MTNETSTVDGIRESLAAVAHNSWAHWMWHVFQISEQNADGSVTISSDNVTRWRRQMVTTYPDLTEREKESDRVEADKMITAINQRNSKRN